MVEGIRQVERALGSGLKEPTVAEMKNRVVARKSIVAKKDIQPSEILNISNLDIKRPGNGISPSKYWSLLGGKATKFYKKDELIDE